jgi:hypothetical protein
MANNVAENVRTNWQGDERRRSQVMPVAASYARQLQLKHKRILNKFQKQTVFAVNAETGASDPSSFLILQTEARGR